MKIIRPKTDVFLSMCEDAKSLNENNDCTVKAIAITTGVEYKKVHKALKKVGRKDSKGATIWQMQRACLALGFQMKSVSSKSFLDKYPKSAKLKNITTNHPERFNKAWKDGKNYILSTRSHVAAVVDGTNHDWTLGRKYRVQIVYEVTPA